jgi:hypothetical protein
VPIGLDPELEKAIEDFTATKKARETRISGLLQKTKLGGVKGMAAQNEIVQMEREDLTEMNRIELTLNAAKRKASKSSGEIALAKKKNQEKEEAAEKLRSSRERLAAKASLWETRGQ